MSRYYILLSSVYLFICWFSMLYVGHKIFIFIYIFNKTPKYVIEFCCPLSFFYFFVRQSPTNVMRQFDFIRDKAGKSSLGWRVPVPFLYLFFFSVKQMSCKISHSFIKGSTLL